MARAKATTVATPVATVASFYHPTPEQMVSAGFRLIQDGVWSWFHDAPDIGGRFHVTVSLLPKHGEVFIYRAGSNNPPPKNTTVAAADLFVNLLKQYGWRQPQRGVPVHAQSRNHAEKI